MEDKQLKVFELKWNSQGEKEWVCAYTNIEALVTYFNITGASFVDLSGEDEIIEVPKDKWSEYFIVNSEWDENDPEDWEKKSFADYMKDQTTPDVIASTIY